MSIDTEILEVKSCLQQVNTQMKDFAADAKQQIKNHVAISMSAQESLQEQSSRLLTLEQIVAKNEQSGQGRVSGAPVSGPTEFKLANGQKVLAYSKDAKIQNSYHDDTDGEFSIRSFCRVGMGIQRPSAVVTNGPATTTSYIGAGFIDRVREKLTLVQAGTRTFSLDGKTTFCRIDGDPVAYVHDGEGIEDISETVPTFSPVVMVAPAIVVACPVSHEITEDSVNFEESVTTSIVGAVAQRAESLFLSTILADGNIPTSSVEENPNSWRGVLAAVKTAMGFNQNVPLACISNSADFVDRASELAEGYGWLFKPGILEKMLELPTNNLSPGSAIFGDFYSGFGIGVRSDIRLELLRFAKHKSYSHILYAHVRIGGFVMQPDALYIQNSLASI